ncbi:MAG: hypothetical protein HYZ48_03700 [Chlamydiales bacterium]|nr:hypothetical protein [Chlamydiales bacterium]
MVFLTSWQLTPKTLTRAAVDVGSGSIKVSVAKIDPISQKIHKILYSQEHPIPFKRDIQVGGESKLSEKIQAVALEKLEGLKKDFSKKYNIEQWRGIATAASRQAVNAQEMFQKIDQKLDIPISIISQNEEGRLGFETAKAVSAIDPEKLIAVDSGSGSFQLTTLIDGNLEVIEGELGYIPSLEMLMEIRKERLDLNTPPAPVTLEEAVILNQKLGKKMPSISSAFRDKINAPSTTIIGIGNENFIFAMGATGVGKATFTKEELWKAIEAHAGKQESEMTQFAKPNTAVLGMVLLYSIMDGMGIEKITACHANGSCEGLLIDKSYWSSPC